MVISAISDGILNNDAFKHCDGETKNESWTKIIKDLKFFDENIKDHTMYLRKIFVDGAKTWMAGKYESQVDDKTLFSYTDSEWNFIWSEMLVDGAWNVPAITDQDGNFVKENYGPEILIKYIAHVLRCHILVYDLSLNKIQFLSGNHVKKNNVLFKSPLLLYNTGSHFQSLFQEDHEYFIKYAEKLEAEYNASNQEKPSKGKHQDPEETSNPSISLRTAKKRKLRKSHEEEYNWGQLNHAKQRKAIQKNKPILSLEETDRKSRNNFNGRCTDIYLRKEMERAQTLMTQDTPVFDDKESIWNNIFSCKENIADPMKEQLLQIHSAFDASKKLIESYKYIKKADRSFTENKLLKKARYNIARLTMLYPSRIGINWTQVRNHILVVTASLKLFGPRSKKFV